MCRRSQNRLKSCRPPRRKAPGWVNFKASSWQPANKPEPGLRPSKDWLRQCDLLARMEYDFLLTKRVICWLSVTMSMNGGGTPATTISWLRKQGSATFVAIAQGQLPQESWFALGRLLTTAGGEPILLSWSGSMFEYLMPLLVMPTYEQYSA